MPTIPPINVKKLHEFPERSGLNYDDLLHVNATGLDYKFQATKVADFVQADLYYDTLAELIAETDAEKVKVGKRVVTFANQNGAAIKQEWEIVPNLTGTADGGSYVNLTGSGLQAKQIFGEIITPEHFGAAGTGLVDDLIYLQNAHNYCDVLDINNTYLVSAEFNINKKITLRGNGSIRPVLTSDINTIRITADNVKLYDIDVYTVNSRVSSGDGIILDTVDKCAVMNVGIVYGTTKVRDGIKLINSNNNTVLFTRYNTAPDTNGVLFTEGGADIQLSENCSYNEIGSNYCTSGNVYGINLTVTVAIPTCKHNKIHHNTVANSTAYGIIAYRAGSVDPTLFSDNDITHNTVKNITGGALDTLGVKNFGSAIYLQMCYDSLVSHNTIDGCALQTGATTLPIGGISGTQNKATITNNIVKNSNQHGIYMSSGDDAAITPDADDSHLILAANKCIDVAKKGFWVVNAHSADIDNNYALRAGNEGFFVSSSATWKTELNFTGNRSKNCLSGAVLNNIEFLTLHDNKFEDSTIVGLQVGNDVADGVVGDTYVKGATTAYNIQSPVHFGPSNKYSGTVTTPFTGGYTAIRTLTNSATPSVKNGEVFLTGGTTTITDLTNYVLGQTVTIRALHVVTIQNGSTIALAGGVDFNMTGGNTLTLCRYDSTRWTEVSRKV